MMHRSFTLSIKGDEGISLFNSNKGKNKIIQVDNICYARFPIQTYVTTEQDNITDIVQQYAAKYIQEGDILFISEKVLACSQNRAIPLNDFIINCATMKQLRYNFDAPIIYTPYCKSI